MAKTKTKKKAATSSGEAHRVNMTFTPEEYEMLVEAGAKEMRPPTVMAKYLVMKALSGPLAAEGETKEAFERSNGQDG